MKADDGAYYSFEKDVDVDEYFDFTSVKTEADVYARYIGAELKLPDKYSMKRMEIVRQRLHDAGVNPDGTGNYRSWADHTEYEI